MNNKCYERKAFLEKAETYIARGLYRRALGLADERLNRFQGDVDARLVICRVMIHTGDFDGARGMMEEVEEIVFCFSRIYASMGDLCKRKGLAKEAISFYRKFLHLNPKSPITKDVSSKLDGLLTT